MSAPQIAIPYESQAGMGDSRACGAACLSMVYGSLGRRIPQAEIWPAISKPNRLGQVSSTTHLMVQDALNRGFAALAFQARHPLQALRLCRDAGARAIMNHRTRPEAVSGHYSVLVAIEEQDVVVHDPAVGPARRISHRQLVELWLPRFQDAEIAGNVLIAVASADQPPPTPCEFCSAVTPAAIACPRCKEPVPLAPTSPLGCVNMDCIARMWNFVLCPACDTPFTFSGGAPSPSASRPEPASDPAQAAEKPPVDLEPVFSALDKFSEQVLRVPAAVEHPEVKKYLDILAKSKDELRLALAEAMANRKIQQETEAQVLRAAQQRRQEHEKRMEAINTPSPALDANELGRALLRQLGFTN